MNDNDLFDLVYNGRTGDFEYSCAKDKGGNDSLTDSLFPTPPQSLEELIGGVANEIASRYNEKKEEALDTIRFYERIGLHLTEEEKIELFKEIITR